MLGHAFSVLEAFARDKADISHRCWRHSVVPVRKDHSLALSKMHAIGNTTEFGRTDRASDFPLVRFRPETAPGEILSASAKATDARTYITA